MNGTMQATTEKLKVRFDAVTGKATAFWQARNARERRVLTVAGALIAVLVIYGLLIAPALNGRATLSSALPAMRQQIAQMQTMTREATTLAESNSSVNSDISKKSIEAMLARKGLRAQSIGITDDTVRLQLSKVAYADLLMSLSDLQRDARLTVIDATFAAAGDADQVDARVTLHRLLKQDGQS